MKPPRIRIRKVWDYGAAYVVERRWLWWWFKCFQHRDEESAQKHAAWLQSPPIVTIRRNGSGPLE